MQASMIKLLTTLYAYLFYDVKCHCRSDLQETSDNVVKNFTVNPFFVVIVRIFTWVTLWLASTWSLTKSNQLSVFKDDFKILNSTKLDEIKSTIPSKKPCIITVNISHSGSKIHKYFNVSFECLFLSKLVFSYWLIIFPYSWYLLLNIYVNLYLFYRRRSCMSINA